MGGVIPASRATSQPIAKRLLTKLLNSAGTGAKLSGGRVIRGISGSPAGLPLRCWHETASRVWSGGLIPIGIALPTASC
jgi:hypothetical protein